MRRWPGERIGLLSYSACFSLFLSFSLFSFSLFISFSSHIAATHATHAIPHATHYQSLTTTATYFETCWQTL
jgi:hypothetical protein